MTAAHPPQPPSPSTERSDHLLLLVIATALLGLLIAGLAFFVADLVELFQTLERSAAGSTP